MPNIPTIIESPVFHDRDAKFHGQSKCDFPIFSLTQGALYPQSSKGAPCLQQEGVIEIVPPFLLSAQKHIPLAQSVLEISPPPLHPIISLRGVQTKQ